VANKPNTTAKKKFDGDGNMAGQHHHDFIAPRVVLRFKKSIYVHHPIYHEKTLMLLASFPPEPQTQYHTHPHQFSHVSCSGSPGCFFSILLGRFECHSTLSERGAALAAAATAAGAAVVVAARPRFRL
jgi:hypothetical protein